MVHRSQQQQRNNRAKDRESAVALLKEKWLGYALNDMGNVVCEYGIASNTLTVQKDIRKGEEILRHYGHEWLHIVYGNLRSVKDIP
eukprot:CAMPEP_0178738150 /NCGR_PEP_ID=MMETSP0744-20121128/3359_1 /TAXON_ID=913974 /ORGANISM="Nitzschia punctata, Strain CCMP561" /LENGTH=85 /DNA_ID=CAMNT_0020390749 /DNA_START=404 /DNA_END=661 /DNA_ORIENTATION=+